MTDNWRHLNAMECEIAELKQQLAAQQDVIYKVREKLSIAHCAIHLSVQEHPGKKQVEEALAALDAIAPNP